MKMFSHVIKQITYTKHLKPVVLSNNFIVFDRHKSTAILPLPNSMQIIKPTPQSSSAASLRIKTINKAMKAYLDRAKQHEDFLKVKNDEFEIGKHHLANMMGLDAATLNQDDIDRAIEYLLPSGLYEKKARPMMKPPKVLFPKEKAAQFDNQGRPFSPFFYTRKGNYYTAIHSLMSKFQELDTFEDKMIAKGILEPPKDTKLNLIAGQWINLNEMNEMFLEKLNEFDHEFLINTLNRLTNHPYSFRCKDEILKYHKVLPDIGSLAEIQPLLKDADGRAYMKAEGKRKHCVANVTVRGEGTGKVAINGTDIFFFPRLHDREQIMFPLEFTDMLGLVDIEVDVSGIGDNARAGAVRLGIALCLRSFLQPNDVEKMRLAGLLTHDRRRRGRKKCGQKGNRAKFTWKKR